MADNFNDDGTLDYILGRNDSMREGRDTDRRLAQRLVDRAKWFKVEAERSLAQARLIEHELNEETSITPDD